MKRTIPILRILLSIVFIYMIYKETGKWTSSFAALMFLYVELNDYLQKKQRVLIDELMEFIKQLTKQL